MIDSLNTDSHVSQPGGIVKVLIGPVSLYLDEHAYTIDKQMNTETILSIYFL